MGKKHLLEFIKEKVSAIAWRLFLWGIDSTEEQYCRDIYEQEKGRY